MNKLQAEDMHHVTRSVDIKHQQRHQTNKSQMQTEWQILNVNDCLFRNNNVSYISGNLEHLNYLKVLNDGDVESNPGPNGTSKRLNRTSKRKA